MTPREKWQAINMLAGAEVIMRSFGFFYVEQSGIRVVDGGVPSKPDGKGPTAHDAIDAYFNAVTNIGPDAHVTIEASPKPRAVKWSGTHWAAIGRNAP